jgi:preprotein translocase subunit SecA
MRIFGSERIVAIMDRLGAEEGEVISHPLVSRSIGSAQKRVEGRNFEIRKHLKEYDDVMNLQRREIYGLRQRILRGEDLKDEILNQVASCLEDIIMRHTSEGKYPEDWALQPLYGDLQTAFGATYRIPEGELSSKTQDSLFDDVWKVVRDRYQNKETRFGAEVMRQFERSVFLMVIDNLWKDHLYEMDHLKGGVQYRSFGQKNPLFEYQREGLKMFEELRSSISREVSNYIFRLERVEQEPSRNVDTSQTLHGDFDVFSTAEAEPQRRAAPVGVPPGVAANRSDLATRRTYVKTGADVGRNDPCPCGSGKKYKKCCGAV